jgi:hypothetical protein
MKIPDYVSPIIGYRRWKLCGGTLTSLNGYAWTPGRALVAKCRTHIAPQLKCSCGIYACKPDSPMGTMSKFASLHGEVSLWGTVVEHEDGWRAERAYPRTLVISLQNRPAPLQDPQVVPNPEQTLDFLIAYRVEIFMAIGMKIISVWTPRKGYNLRALNELRGYFPVSRHESEPGGSPPPSLICSVLDAMRVLRSTVRPVSGTA